MTREEAKQQIEAFFRRIGEALIGFEYDETEEILSAQALIYRFRGEPQDNVLDAVFAEARFRIQFSVR